jgi:Ala-tRNA(Pro) deacylase
MNAEIPPESDGQIAAAIQSLIDAARIAGRWIDHEPTLTSVDSAKARAEPLEVGGKTLLLRVDDHYGLYVFSAARKLDNTAIRKHFGTRNTRFATREELWQATGLVSGSVPPFGKPTLPFTLYADPSIVAQPRIAFNAGLLTRSCVIATSDWLSIAKPIVFEFSQSQ